MSRPLIASALSASMLAPGAAALAQPHFSPGITLVNTAGEGPMSGFSMGAEATLNATDIGELNYGALLQLEFAFDGGVRFNIGGQAFGPMPVGLELAWSVVLHDGDVENGVMLAPFLGVGFINAVWRNYFGPSGVTMAGALSFKAPLTMIPAIDGRPLRDADGMLHKPAVVVLGRRARPRPAADLPGASSRPLGRAWLEAARDEHAAVDAFRRLARQLHRRGAPVGLIRRALRSARDERRHARDSLDIAEALLGQRLALVSTPLPDGRLPDLAEMAVESRLDGVIAEGAAARIAALGARRAAVGPVERLQGAIAREEAGHAELGAAIAHWAAETGGRSVRAALADAKPADADAVDPGPQAPAGDEALWRRWGRPSVAERRDAWRAASA